MSKDKDEQEELVVGVGEVLGQTLRGDERLDPKAGLRSSLSSVQLLPVGRDGARAILKGGGKSAPRGGQPGWQLGLRTLMAILPGPINRRVFFFFVLRVGRLALAASVWYNTYRLSFHFYDMIPLGTSKQTRGCWWRQVATPDELICSERHPHLFSN